MGPDRKRVNPPKPVRPKSQTINERDRLMIEVIRQGIKHLKNESSQSDNLTQKERVAKIYWEAGKRFKHHGEEYIETFRETFLELCKEDGIKW